MFRVHPKNLLFDKKKLTNVQYSVDRGATLDTCLEKIEKSNSLNERSMIFKKRLKKI